nr:hypothetical protein [Tanacetum cinerariifolium]
MDKTGLNMVKGHGHNGGKPLKSILNKTTYQPSGSCVTSDAGGLLKSSVIGAKPCGSSLKRQITLSPIVSVREFVSEYTTIDATTEQNEIGVGVYGADVGKPIVNSPIVDKIDIRTNKGSKEDGSGVMKPNVQPTRPISFANVLKVASNQESAKDGTSSSEESFASVPKPSITKNLNFMTFVNEEKVENSNFVLPRDAIDKVKNRIGLEQVLERRAWLIHNTPLILNKWTSSLPLKKDEVTKIPVVAYSEDGFSLIATQVGKPLMLDAFTCFMCVEPWSYMGFTRSLVEISSDMELTKEVIMAIPNGDGTSHTRVVISMEKKDKGKKVDMQPKSRQFSGVRFNQPKPNLNWQKKGIGRSGDDMDTSTKVGNNSINKVKGSATSNSFDALNTLDVEDEIGASSLRGNKEEEQEARLNLS